MKKPTNIIITKLPEILKGRLNKALDDFKSGNYITHDEMKAKAEKWLSKRKA